MMEYEQKDNDDRDGPPLTQHGTMDAVLKGSCDHSRSAISEASRPWRNATRINVASR